MLYSCVLAIISLLLPGLIVPWGTEKSNLDCVVLLAPNKKIQCLGYNRPSINTHGRSSSFTDLKSEITLANRWVEVCFY